MTPVCPPEPPVPLWRMPQFIAAASGLIGVVLTFVLQRYADFVKPLDRLRKDLKANELGAQGQKRLRPIALADQKRFTATFECPSAAYLNAWDRQNHAIFICPAGGFLRAEAVPGECASQQQAILVKVTSCAEAGSPSQSMVERELSAILKGRAESVATFQEMVKLAEPKQPVLVIVECLGITVQRSQAIDQLFDTIRNQIHVFFSAAVIGLAVYAPQDVIEERRPRGTLPWIVLPGDSAATSDVKTAAQEYTLLRDAISAQLAEGIVLRRHNDQIGMNALAHKKMMELAHARLKGRDVQGLFRSNGNDTVGTVCIWGPPGSGKTGLANLLCTTLQAQKAIVLDIYGFDIAPLFVSGSLANIAAIDNLLKPCAYSRMQLALDQFGQTRQAFEDAWSYALQQRKQVLWLLVEDLYSQRAIRNNIDRLRELSHHVNVHVLVVDRKRLPSLRRLDESFAEFECCL